MTDPVGTDAGDLADEYWRYYRDSQQLWNIDRGEVDEIERWEDLSPDGMSERIERLTGFAQRADTCDRSKCNERELVLLGALSFSARSSAAILPYQRDLALVAGPFGFDTFLSLLVPAYALITRHHGAGYVEKLRAMPSFVDGWTSGLHDGLAHGRVATTRGIARAVTAYDSYLRTALAHDPLASQSPPVELSVAEADVWRAEVVAAIGDAVRPALAGLRDALRDELLPSARSDEHAGMCHLPGGDEAYAALVWASTSTDLTPAEVHEIGLEQLARLDDEYTSLGGAVLGLDDPAQLRQRLRDDVTLRYATADEIAVDVTAALARAQAEAPRWFTKVPQAQCTALAVDTGPLAFYTAPSPDGSRNGTFFYNRSNPAAWPRHQLEVTAFHEAVPGHHFQLALALELDLHPLVGQLEVVSFGEGWGLYAERLADEMSLYSSPRQRLGMVTMDSLHASRLVADTGLHAMGWTRDEAIAFLLGHTAQDAAVAAAEVDRYIADPGQATSYMIGRLEIERLRRHAAGTLGDKFSVRRFHDAVLAQGNVPLGELARSIDRWMDEEHGPSGPSTA